MTTQMKVTEATRRRVRDMTGYEMAEVLKGVKFTVYMPTPDVLRKLLIKKLEGGEITPEDLDWREDAL